MKKLIVFDLDGTLAESKSSLDTEMSALGQMMEPEPGNPREVGGALNPAAVHDPNGELYLFLRLATQCNYSRIRKDANYEI